MGGPDSNPTPAGSPSFLGASMRAFIEASVQAWEKTSYTGAHTIPWQEESSLLAAARAGARGPLS